MMPREFLNEVVMPNVADLHASYTEVRSAFNAVAAVDALAAGPVGIRQLRHGMAPLCAAAAVAMVLLAAQAPVNSGAVWGRIVAALAVAAAATAAGAALWMRQTGKQSAQTGPEEPPAHSPHR